jgi:phosphate transport system substrate-binding protein
MHALISRTAVLVALTAALMACDASSIDSTGNAIVRVDGSSTVFPLTQAVVGEFIKANPLTQVRSTISGTGGGFQNFCMGRIDVGAAGRPIRRSEIEGCHEAGVTFIELPIAYDGIAVVVNPKATFINEITVDELKLIWRPEARVTVHRWSQVRAGWPDRNIHLFGPDLPSGTYDHFAAAVVGGNELRSDFTASADDEVIAQAIAQDEQAMGILPLAYYERAKRRLKVLGIANGNDADGAGAITPTPDSIRAGTYQPLARPIFVYVREQALNRPAVREFVDFYLARAGDLAVRVGYIPLGDDAYELVAERRRKRWTGTVFGEGGPQVGLTIAQLLDKARIH